MYRNRSLVIASTEPRVPSKAPPVTLSTFFDTFDLAKLGKLVNLGCGFRRPAMELESLSDESENIFLKEQRI